MYEYINYFSRLYFGIHSITWFSITESKTMLLIIKYWVQRYITIMLPVYLKYLNNFYECKIPYKKMCPRLKALNIDKVTIPSVLRL